MFLEDRRQIGVFLLANIAAIYANGQSYADRTNLHNGIALEEEEDEYLINTEYYNDNNHDSFEIRRWNVEEFPHPQLDSPSHCHRMSSGSVCDPDLILTKDQVYTLDAIIQKLYNDTICICDSCEAYEGGIQIGIALLKHTFQPYLEHSSKIIRSFTENLRSKWRLGKCENDILIVLATDDRQSYTDVGYHAAQYVSKAQAYHIFLENKEHFSKGEYFDGLLKMLKSYEKLTKDFAKNKNDSGKNVALISGIVVIIVIIIGIVICVSIILYKRKTVNQAPKKKIERNERSSSWRSKNIKTLFSSFVSTNDAYQPCKTKEDHPDKSRCDMTDNGTKPNTNDEEILNLELAEPDPKPEAIKENNSCHESQNPFETCKETDYNENEKKIEETCETTPVLQQEPSDINSKHNHQIPDTNEKLLEVKIIKPVTNNTNPFETFTKLEPKQLHQTDL